MKKKARCFGQDLMRGEHVVGTKRAPTDRPTDRPRRQPMSGKKKSGLTSPGKAAEFDGYRVQEGTRQETDTSGTSIFDPVLCEIAYRWFCPPGGIVLDPFAGGSVRGIVAAMLGREYVGIELRSEQVKANEGQRSIICSDAPITWLCGDSTDLATLYPKGDVDFIFTCPPYADLEVYSDDPRDLSAMKYGDFVEAYRKIISLSCDRLKEDRFAMIIVGDIRDKKGIYRNFPGDTIDAFQSAGLKLYNEAILVTAVGSLPIRAGGQFRATRKLGKTHQNVYVFVKGNPKKATKAIGPVACGDAAVESAAGLTPPDEKATKKQTA